MCNLLYSEYFKNIFQLNWNQKLPGNYLHPMLFNQPCRSTQPGHPSVGRWVVIRHTVYW